MSETMRALVMFAPGGPEVLQVREIARPKIERPSDVLVRVTAAGVNPADWQNRKSGQRHDPYAATGSPTILGIDGVGVIEDIGDAVDGISIGDEVWYIDGGYPGNPGSYAEYKVIHGAYVSRKPASVDFVQAAALPVVGLTAWEAVFDKGNVKSGDHVLVHGGAGGLGHIAIQYLANIGARTATTVSNEVKAEFVLGMGAEIAIRYRSEDVNEKLRSWSGKDGAAVVFDFVGHENFARSFEHVAPYGRLVNTVVSDWPSGGNALAEWKNLDVSFVNIGLPQIARDHRNRLRQVAVLDAIANLVDTNKLRAHIDRVVSFDGVGEAHRALEAGETIGRVVLRL
ncbi:NADPH:quinone reductase-like Zn-dependent oxidoreductase [Phyllobacterium trifolii]|uniref:NADPH:quinone reductase-like Zn-dependent oxidoreductase n=1 Tax=Phyllobacterium trifolii TaxID=300193 RepID=A0A839UHR0_9HYPH|nr:zinc-binding dehydrogenase [Phyllobacterium trifolii]MBB3149344.1 NADPH:quinone reductase-like Zn-dependent oxidoreductase [Phyllobacterium trifolii]